MRHRRRGRAPARGPQCFLGYVDTALDAAAFDADGWFRTGDLGTLDADGNVSVTGRIKDIIIRNAENISALEIEEALYQHPAVVDVAVVAAPDRRTGERVCVFVVPVPDAPPPTLTDLADHCRSLGLAYKCPEQLELVDSLPHNSFGKVLKQDLKARSSRLITPEARARPCPRCAGARGRRARRPRRRAGTAVGSAGRSLPSRTIPNSSSRSAALASGRRPAQSPQSIPMTVRSLNSTWLSAIWGMSPLAKPITT